MSLVCSFGLWAEVLCLGVQFFFTFRKSESEIAERSWWMELHGRGTMDPLL